MLEKDSGVVLRAVKYGDNAVIVDIFTSLRGTVGFIVRFPKARRRARLSSVLFRPLTVLEIDYNFRLSASLQHIADAQPLIVFRSLPYHPHKSAMALFLSEFLSRALKNETANAPLFSFLVYSLEWFDAADAHFADFHIVFLARLTRFLGFYPNVGGHHNGEFFDMRNACFSPARPQHASFLNPDEAAYVPFFSRVSFDSMHLIRMNGKQRRRCLAVLIEYYKLHVPDFPDLKSLDVLTDVFS